MVNHIIYFDNFYTSLPLLVLLKSKGIYSLGTIKRERIPNCKLPSDKESKMKRGEVIEYVGSAYGVDMTTIQWKDTKNVCLASTYVGNLPFSKANDGQMQLAKAIRYDRKDKNYLEVDCPHIINEYNAHMGGVDTMDGLLGRYRIRLKTCSYSHRLFYHFIDMTVVNSYLLYRRIHKDDTDHEHVELPDFRFLVGDVLTTFQPPQERNPVGRPPKDVVRSCAGRTKTYLPPPEIRFDQYDHWPNVKDVKGKRKCKLPGCKYKTQVTCMKCNLNLCLLKDRNCFVQFHKK
ncbi:piggyBac transposable element-derived protein 3-like [Rhagoletis pomonella]|nr:piggyBac transposable element-derived protein 3-like [Rhagoletis pomonella]